MNSVNFSSLNLECCSCSQMVSEPGEDKLLENWPGHQRCALSGRGSPHYTGWNQVGSPPPQCPSVSTWGFHLVWHRPSQCHLTRGSTPPPHAARGETTGVRKEGTIKHVVDSRIEVHVSHTLSDHLIYFSYFTFLTTTALIGSVEIYYLDSKTWYISVDKES